MGYIFELKGVNGQLFVDNDYVGIERKGFMGTMTYGHRGRQEIPYCSIKAVEVREGTPLINGFIQFFPIGSEENKEIVFGTLYYENKIIFVSKNNELAMRIKEFVLNKIREAEVRQKSKTGV